MNGEGPLRNFLASWRPILPRQKFFHAQIELAPGISEDQLIDMVSQSKWAQDTAEGVVSKLQLSGPQREKAKQAWAHAVAEGFVTGSGVKAPRRR